MFDEFGPVMTIQEACNELMVGRNTIYSLIHSGLIPAYRSGNSWRIPSNELSNYIRQISGLIPKEKDSKKHEGSV